jgi:hypothetical protein
MMDPARNKAMANLKAMRLTLDELDKASKSLRADLQKTEALTKMPGPPAPPVPTPFPNIGSASRSGQQIGILSKRLTTQLQATEAVFKSIEAASKRQR